MWSEDSPHGLLGISCEVCHQYSENDSREPGVQGHNIVEGHRFSILKENEVPVVCKQCHGEIEGILSNQGALDALLRIQLRTEDAVTDLESILLSAEQSIDQAAITTGADPDVIKEASAMLESTKRVFDQDIARDYSKGFHNPAGTLDLINKMIRNATKAQVIALQSVITGMSKILESASGQVAEIIIALTLSQENINKLEANQESIQNTLSEKTNQIESLVYLITIFIAITLIAFIVIMIVVTRNLKLKRDRKTESLKL
jgi:hypothetical protein